MQNAAVVRATGLFAITLLIATAGLRLTGVLARPGAKVAPGEASRRSPVAIRVAQRPARSKTPRATATVTVNGPRSRRPSGRSRRRARGGRQPGFQRRGAFAPNPVQSKDRMFYLMQKYPSFKRNLARHFGVSEPELIQYFNENLQLRRLPKALRTQVFGVTPSGRIFSEAQRIPAGALVFTLPDGTAVLKEICGNPVLSYLPPMPGSAPVATAIIPARPLAPIVPPTLAAAAIPPPGALPFSSVSVPVAPTPVFTPTLVAAAPATVTPVMPMLPSQVSPLFGGGGGGFPFPILALGGLGFIHGGGGGRPPRGLPRPIPEPSTTLALTIGALLVGGAYCLNRRRQFQPVQRRY